MPNIEAEIAGRLQEELVSYGVGVYTSKGVTGIRDRSVLLDDGTSLDADMVLMSVGVRPTLTLARDAGLDLGEAGGLLVDEYLRTSDENIFAAGDMVEIEQRISGKKVRIPLAGPANRQGRLAAGNILGVKRAYSGAMGTSVVRVFEAVAGSTGLNLAQARNAGMAAEAVVVHKEHHTSYYPGATPVTVLVIYDRETGRILGGQTAGYKGADKRLDVLAAAAAGKMTIHDLAELDLSYSPPIGTPNDPVNMAAYVAENRVSGYSPSITAAEVDAFVREKNPVILDLRDVFAFEKGHVSGALHVPEAGIRSKTKDIPKKGTLLLYDDHGKKSHQALRFLVQNGYTDVRFVSGGYVSLERQARAAGFSAVNIPVPEPERKSIANKGENSDSGGKPETRKEAEAEKVKESSRGPLEGSDPVVIDVRTPEEFKGGAFPNAVNLPLDELVNRLGDLGGHDRKITVYCASGARSAYAKRMLQQSGFKNVENGGGLMDMMARRR